MASDSKTTILKLPQWLGNEYLEREDMNTAFETIEEASCTIDYLARTYGYSVAVSGLTTTLTIDASAPVTATRKTVISSVGSTADGGYQCIVTTTVNGASKTMTHVIANGQKSIGDGDVVPFEALVNLTSNLAAAIRRQLQQLGQDLNNMSEKLQGDITEQGNNLARWWVYAKDQYNYTYTPPTDPSAASRVHLEELDDGTTKKASLRTQVNADGTYEETYYVITDAGTTERTRTWTKIANGQWKGVWS